MRIALELVPNARVELEGGVQCLEWRSSCSRFGRPLSWLTYVRRGFCICRVVRDPQLGIESTMVAVLLGNGDSNHCATS